MREAKPIAHLVWQRADLGDDVEAYYEVARPGDKSVDGSDPFPVYEHAAITQELNRLREENERLRERGQAFANQVRHIVRHLHGQAYSSTVSELNAFDAALSPIEADKERKP